jgi:HD-GYP domain-containing protein (c-di-GMP phosphodiesterase class II)
MSIVASQESYFSVSFELIVRGQPLPYDLFLNSSVIESREKFVRIAPQGEVLSFEDLMSFQKKYRQLYVPETQRSAYLKSIVQSSKSTEIEKTTVIRDTAIKHLAGIFDQNQPMTPEVLTQHVTGCKDAVDSMVNVIENYSIDQLKSLIGSLSFHDFYTFDHSINVSMYSVIIYKALFPNAKSSDVVVAGMGGLLHDLGKIKIPTTIINNPGKLSDEDFQQIKKHPEYGLGLLGDSQVSLPDALDRVSLCRAIFEHHENYDGTGYPRKIVGENIHILARITAVADFFDAITTKRSYHEALTTEQALALMAKSCGKKLDPVIFKAFAQKTQEYDQCALPQLALSPDFDPCQPCNKLPFVEVPVAAPVEPAAVKESHRNALPRKPVVYGKVKIVESQGRSTLPLTKPIRKQDFVEAPPAGSAPATPAAAKPAETTGNVVRGIIKKTGT